MASSRVFIRLGLFEEYLRKTELITPLYPKILDNLNVPILYKTTIDYKPFLFFDSYEMIKIVINLDFLFFQLEIVMYGRFIDGIFSSPFIKKYIQNNFKKKAWSSGQHSSV